MAEIVGILSAVVVATAGYYKTSPAMAWLPVDPTAPALAVLFLAITVQGARRWLVSGVRLSWSGGAASALVVVGLLVASFLPGLAVTSWDAESTDKLTKLALLVLPCLVAPVILLRTRRGLLAAVGGLAGVGVMLMAAALIWPAKSIGWGRFTLAGSDYVGFGRATASAVVFVATVAIVHKRGRLITLAASGLGFVVIFATGSRAPLLASVLVLGVVVGKQLTWRSHRRTLLGLGSAAVFLGVASLLLAPAMRVRLLALFENQEVFGYASRGHLYEEAIRLGLSHPFGVGWGDLMQMRTPAENAAFGGAFRYSHNLVLETLVEGGWLACLALMAFLLIAIRASWRAAQSSTHPVSQALFSSSLLWLLLASFAGDLPANRPMFLVLSAGLTHYLVETRAPLKTLLGRPSFGDPASWFVGLVLVIPAGIGILQMVSGP